MKTHTLKTIDTYFKAIAKGNKTADIRLYDRAYEVGDILELEEITPCYYTGRVLMVQVTHILRRFVGLQNGYCMLSFRCISDAAYRHPRRRLPNA